MERESGLQEEEEGTRFPLSKWFIKIILIISLPLIFSLFLVSLQKQHLFLSEAPLSCRLLKETPARNFLKILPVIGIDIMTFYMKSSFGITMAMSSLTTTKYEIKCASTGINLDQTQPNPTHVVDHGYYLLTSTN